MVKTQKVRRHDKSGKMVSTLRQKGGDLTQSYDKSPYTHGNTSPKWDRTNILKTITVRENLRPNF